MRYLKSNHFEKNLAEMSMKIFGHLTLQQNKREINSMRYITELASNMETSSYHNVQVPTVILPMGLNVVKILRISTDLFKGLKTLTVACLLLVLRERTVDYYIVHFV